MPPKSNPPNQFLQAGACGMENKTERNNEMKCCICGKKITILTSHNPWPIVTDGKNKCCEECNKGKVIPARLREIGVKKI